MRKTFQSANVFAVLLLHAVVATAAVEVTRPEDVGMSSERLEYLASYFEGLVDDKRSGGYQILISRHGKVVMYENMGLANVEDNVPVTDETLFRIYSMTKPVVGVAMMMLYEEGHYSLSDPLSKHIPEFAELRVYAGEDEQGNMQLEPMKREPTIHDLMQHTAGFTYGIFGDSGVDRAYVDGDVLNYDQKFPEFIGKLADIPLLFQPGERWNYSVAVDIQGYLIEKWTGMKLADFLEERLFVPLGMDQTMPWVPPGQAHLLANVYSHDENGQQVQFEGEFATNHLRAPGEFGGGGQLLSTADDYWRFSQMLLNGGELEGERYLSPLTVEMMSDNRLREPAQMGPGTGFGLNVGVITDNTKVDYPASNGEYYWSGLASTVFWIDPEEELVAIMLTQYLPFDGAYYSDLMHRLVRAAVID